MESSFCIRFPNAIFVGFQVSLVRRFQPQVSDDVRLKPKLLCFLGLLRRRREAWREEGVHQRLVGFAVGSFRRDLNSGAPEDAVDDELAHAIQFPGGVSVEAAEVEGTSAAGAIEGPGYDVFVAAMT